MSPAVSCVVPALADFDLLAAHLPPLLREVGAVSGEVIVVDDTGTGYLAPWLGARFPAVRVVTQERNGGFARALIRGAQAARFELVFSMNPDVRVHPGVLERLVESLADPTVFAATPRVLLRGEDQVESGSALELSDGRARSTPPVPARSLAPGAEVAVAFPLGGAFLARTAELLELGLDPLYEPFYVEDVDLGWRAWRSGRRVVLRNDAVVEHHNRGTIGRAVDEELRCAAIERNWLLFQWKHLEDSEDLTAHLRDLHARAFEALVLNRREELEWLALALDRCGAALEAREHLPPPVASFRELARRSDPRR